MKKILDLGEREMVGSQTWTREEAIADLAGLLKAAEGAPQYISSDSGHFMVTFQKHSGEKSANLFSTPGPLQKNDVSDL